MNILLPVDEKFIRCDGAPKVNAPYEVRLNNFINKANIKHGWKFDYSKVVWNGPDDNIIIVCPEHGEFHPHARSHLRGEGKCDQCFRRNTGFYSQGYFANHPEQKSILGKLYFVKIYNDTEAFYKVGITKHGAYHRFYVDEKLPYSLEIIKEVEMPLYDAYCKEQILLEKYSDYYITPLIEFPGKTECLSIDIRDEI